MKIVTINTEGTPSHVEISGDKLIITNCNVYFDENLDVNGKEIICQSCLINTNNNKFNYIAL